MTLVDRFITWAKSRAPHVQPIVTFAGEALFDRYEFLRSDEWPDSQVDSHKCECKCWFCPSKKEGWRWNALPWWMPFNAFLHHWKLGPDTPESFHDHPRWSITICLKGNIIERTPWGKRLLRPGSIVVRSRKAIHAFEVPADAGEVWTLFIVGRRKHRQNSFEVTAR